MSAPKVTAYMMTSNGRRRSFKVGEFTVMVEPHKDDKAQEEFTHKLAEAATNLDSSSSATGCSHPFCECECHEDS